MAGSLTYRTYTSDTGIAYSIKIDESNANGLVTAGSILCPVRTGNFPALPRGLKKRYVQCYNQANPLERRKLYVGSVSNVTAVTAAGATISAEDYPASGDAAGTAVTWVVTAYRGEKTQIIPSFSSPDTGLTDGTATQ